MAINHDKIKEDIRKASQPTAENNGHAFMIRSQEAANNLFHNEHNIPSLTLANEDKRYEDTFLSDTEALQTISDRFWAEYGKIVNNANLSQKGKEEQIQKAEEYAENQIGALRAIKSFDIKKDLLKDELQNRYNQRRSSLKPEDKVLAYMQQKEAREYVERACEKGKATGSRAIDIKQDLLNRAIDNYSESSETFISAILEPPFPIQVVSSSTKTAAVERLKRVISPNEGQQLEYLEKYQEVFEVIAHGTLESVKRETKQNPYYSISPQSINQ